MKETIARGVESGVLAYMGKSPSGKYQPFHFERSISAADVEISEDMYIITRQMAEEYRAEKTPGNRRDRTRR